MVRDEANIEFEPSENFRISFFFSNMSKAEIRKKLDDKREANGVIEVYHPTYECLQVLQFYYKEGCGE